MSKKTAASPFQALEEEAYHAFREWPVWLVLENASWLPTSMLGSRQFARQLLRTLTNHLQSSSAIKRWMIEEEEP